MTRYWPALLSVALSLGAVGGYVSLLRVPVIRNHPALYVAAFALATAIAALASWRAARWPNLPAPLLSAALLGLGGLFNFLLPGGPATAPGPRPRPPAPPLPHPGAAGAPGAPSG